MSEYEKLRVEYANLLGRFIGVLDGLQWWTLPEGLKLKLGPLRAELMEKYDKLDEENEKERLV